MTSPLYGDRDSERGAGGKLRKPPTRKSQLTPYARPPNNQHARGGGWRLAKIIDPVYRLVAVGATKIMPAFLSKTNAAAAPAALPPPTENPGEQNFHFF